MFVSLPRRSSMGLTRGATRVGSLPAPMRRMLYGNNERRCKLDHSDGVNQIPTATNKTIQLTAPKTMECNPDKRFPSKL